MADTTAVDREIDPDLATARTLASTTGGTNAEIAYRRANIDVNIAHAQARQVDACIGALGDSERALVKAVDRLEGVLARTSTQLESFSEASDRSQSALVSWTRVMVVAIIAQAAFLAFQVVQTWLYNSR